MPDSLDIAEVARLTGLTSRALRFYEARGLIAPLRAYSGRRHYGPAELERLHQILAMKRAGLTIAQIQSMMSARPLDLRGLVLAQVEALAERESEIRAARGLLASILSRIDRSEPIDVATFCSLIRQGELTMTKQKWLEAAAHHMSDDQREAVKKVQVALPKGFDRRAQMEKLMELVGRVKAALPLDPESPQAQPFLDEYDALIEPVRAAISTHGMREGARNVQGKIEQGEVPYPFDPEVYRFLRAGLKARKAGAV